MPIIVYNRNAEDHGVSPNNYPIFRGGSILGNPFTHKELGKTNAIFRVRNREEAIERYSDYFDRSTHTIRNSRRWLMRYLKNISPERKYIWNVIALRYRVTGT